MIPTPSMYRRGNYSSGEDFVLEYGELRFTFNERDFRERCEQAACKVGFIEGEIEPDEAEDLINLVVNGEVSDPVSQPDGDHVLIMLANRPPQQIPFEAARTRVMGDLQADAVTRMKLFKLAWDMVGSEFAGRHLQYEKFYAGASFIIRNHSYRETDWGEFNKLVEDLMASYDYPVERQTTDAGLSVLRRQSSAR